MDVLGVIEWFRGDMYPIPVKLINKDNTPLDLTGYTFLFTVCATNSNDDQLFQVIGIVDDPLIGEVQFTPSDDQTNLPVGTYFYDIQMKSSVITRTVVKNKFKIIQDITKADYSGTFLMENGDELSTEDNRLIIEE